MVLEPGTRQVWELNDQTEKWFIKDEWAVPAGPIPLLTFYAQKTGLMRSEVPLEPIADLNITHWQSNSDQRVVLKVARFPILGGSGVEEWQNSDGVPVEPEIGPKTILTSSEGGKYYFVEHNGAAIKAGADDLENLEKQMSSMGAQFLTKRPSSDTATARALDSSEATSPLEDAAQSFENVLNKAKEMTERMKGQEPTGLLTIQKDFGNALGLREDVPHVLAMENAGIISKKQVTSEMQRRDILSEYYDFDEDRGQRRAEVEEDTALLMPPDEDIDPQAAE